MKSTAMKEQGGNEIRKILLPQLGKSKFLTSPIEEVEKSTSQIVEVKFLTSLIGEVEKESEVP